MNLEKIRAEIDEIDQEIAQLLETRMKLVQDVVTAKQNQQLTVLDSSREQLVLDNIEKNLENPDYVATILETYKDIMKHSRAYQQDFLKK